MATIYDIAKLSKTSAATVSYVLNGKGDEKHISQATQARILDAAQTLNYHPNTSARQLKSSENKMIHISVFWPEINFDQPLLCAMQAVKEVMNQNEEVEINIQFYTPGSLNEKMQKFAFAGCNGILIAGPLLDDLKYLSENRKNLPIVLINRHLDGFPCSVVDQEAAGALAFDIAHRYADESVLTIWDSRFRVATDLRKTVFNNRSREMGTDLSASQYTCEGSVEGGYELGMKLIKRRLLKKLIYCNNESIALGVLTALNEADIKVGEEVLLFAANSGSDSFCRFTSPAMSCIDLKMQEVFRNGLQLCLSIINHAKPSDAKISLPPRIVLRDSLPEF